jgi:hypothetical protein
MCAELNFDATGVSPAETFEPVPTNWYPVTITESEMKATKDNAGSYLKLKLQIQGGEYDKRVAYAQLNLNNQNPVAVEIAQRQLSAICHAVKIFQVPDSSVLHGHPFMARIVYRQSKKTPLATLHLKRVTKSKGSNRLKETYQLLPLGEVLTPHGPGNKPRPQQRRHLRPHPQRLLPRLQLLLPLPRLHRHPQQLLPRPNQSLMNQP